MRARPTRASPRRWAWALALTLGLAAVEAAPLGAQSLNAYHASWMGDAWREAPLGELDRIYLFEWRVQNDGLVADRQGWPQRWLALRAATRAQAVALDATLTLLDTPTLERVFSRAESRAQLMQTALAVLADPDFDGLQIDFETTAAPSPRSLNAFRDWLAELDTQRRVQHPGKALSGFWQWQQSPNLYDAASLARFDQVVVQGYDAHHPGATHAGPVAPLGGEDRLTWHKALDALRASGMPLQRFVFGYPFFGYEWQVATPPPRGRSLQTARPVTWAALDATLLPDLNLHVAARVADWGAQVEASSGSSSYAHANGDGSWTEGWFESAESLQAHARWLQQHSLGGLAFFVLGYDAHALLGRAIATRGARTLEGWLAAR